MEIKEYPLTCNRIGKVSKKNESSDYAILPALMKPRKPNVLGYYIFKITSDLSNRWTYCRVAEWTADDRDCYLPVWMMNYLRIPEKCEAKFTFEDFSIQKAEAVVIQPTEEIFASYTLIVEMSAIRAALSSYTTLTNNAHITLNVDGQKFPVIIRLLKPCDKARVTPRMEIVVTKIIFNKGGSVVTEGISKDEDMNITTDREISDLLSGLCDHCYRSTTDCKCDEKRKSSEQNRSEKKKEEEEVRRMALDALKDVYCMNCFCLNSGCQCTKAELRSALARESKKLNKLINISGGEDLSSIEERECVLENDDFDIMQIVEKEMKEEIKRQVEVRQKQLEAEGHSREQALEKATFELDSRNKEEEEEEEEEAKRKEVKEDRIIVTGAAVDHVMKPIEEKIKHAIFYYWPILQQENCKRWDVNKAHLIPPPPPDVTDKDDRSKMAKKNSSIWSLFKRRD